MTPKEKFKVGFLLKCAQAGMTMDETLEAVKEAREKLAFGPGDVLKGAWNSMTGLGNAAAKKAIEWAPTIAIGGPIAVGTGIGATGGYLAAKATDVSDDDPNDVKTQELIDEYRRMAEQARLARALQGFKATPRRGRPMY